MITKDQVQQLIEEKINGTDFFIVDLAVKPGNKIEVTMDCDSGMTIEGCTSIHRHIAGNFDRDVEDFELQVSSPGVGQPLKVKRQYFKNVGRTIQVKTNDDQKFEGILSSATDENIVVETKVKEEVPGKKGKKWVEKTISTPFDQIKEAKIVISFK